VHSRSRRRRRGAHIHPWQGSTMRGRDERSEDETRTPGERHVVSRGPSFRWRDQASRIRRPSRAMARPASLTPVTRSVTQAPLSGLAAASSDLAARPERPNPLRTTSRLAPASRAACLRPHAPRRLPSVTAA